MPGPEPSRMPLSEPNAREHIHTRDISCRGYRREDGLWDIEGHLVDTKTYAFDNRFRGEVAPGMPVHEMWLRVTVDDDLRIKDVEGQDSAKLSVEDMGRGLQREAAHRSQMLQQPIGQVL